MLVCLFVLKCLLVCFLYRDALSLSAAGRGSDVHRVWGPPGAARPGVPGHRSPLRAGIPAAAAEAASCRDFTAASEGCSRVALWKWGWRERREVARFPRFGEEDEAAAAKGSKGLQDASLCRGALGGGGTPARPPAPPAAGGGRPLRDPRVLRGLEPRLAASLRVAPPGRSRVSTNPEVSIK